MHRLLSLLAAFVLLAAPLHAAEEGTEQRALVAERDYVPVVPAQPTSAAPGEVEIVEFFWYGCPHCYQAEKHIQAWLAQKPANVKFTRVPATLNRGWVLMAQAYYTAEQLDVLDVMHPALFAAFHEDRVMLDTPESVAQYFKEKAGVEDDAFAQAFNSPTVASHVQRADMLARRYRVNGVPMLAVNGKFVTDPRRTRGYAQMVDVAARLAAQELAAQSE